MTRFLVRIVLGGALIIVLLISVSLAIGRGIHSAQLTFMTVDSKSYVYDTRMNRTMPFHFSDKSGAMLSWSPDGRYLAHRILDLSARPPSQMLLLFDTHTRTNKNIVEINRDIATGSAFDTDVNIAWSPDSTRLLYISRSNQVLLYRLQDDTPTLYDENVSYAVWSPVDERIAMVQDVDGRYWLVVANADGTDRRRLLSMAEANPPRWSPDGRYLMVSSGTNLLGEARLTLIESRHGVVREYGGFTGAVILMSWLPDSRAIYYSDSSIGLCVLDIDSGAITPLTSSQTQYLTPPKTSPDGEWQITMPHRLNGVTIADVGIYLTKAGTDKWQAIAQNADFGSLWRP